MARCNESQLGACARWPTQRWKLATVGHARPFPQSRPGRPAQAMYQLFSQRCLVGQEHRSFWRDQRWRLVARHDDGSVRGHRHGSPGPSADLQTPSSSGATTHLGGYNVQGPQCCGRSPTVSSLVRPTPPPRPDTVCLILRTARPHPPHAFTCADQRAGS